jgi:hypothetical protein
MFLSRLFASLFVITLSFSPVILQASSNEDIVIRHGSSLKNNLNEINIMWRKGNYNSRNIKDERGIIETIRNDAQTLSSEHITDTTTQECLVVAKLAIERYYDKKNNIIIEQDRADLRMIIERVINSSPVKKYYSPVTNEAIDGHRFIAPNALIQTEDEDIIDRLSRGNNGFSPGKVNPYKAHHMSQTQPSDEHEENILFVKKSTHTDFTNLLHIKDAGPSEINRPKFNGLRQKANKNIAKKALKRKRGSEKQDKHSTRKVRRL